jgi:MoaA/NifB/PqqE/SkfB family radical SAM enzyme
MRKTEPFPRSRLPLDAVKRILDAAARNGIKIVSFTGGEPLLLLDDLVQVINYAGRAGIEYIRTGTNGFVFANAGAPLFQSRIERLAERLASTPLRNLWISIDSAIPSVHEKMRGFPGVIHGIQKALPIFHEHGIYPTANLGINRKILGAVTEKVQRDAKMMQEDYHQSFYNAFRKAFKMFNRFVIELGFTIVSNCYPMSIDGSDDSQGLTAVYGATSEDHLVSFSKPEKALLYKALFDTISEFRSQIRVVSPRSSLYALYRQYKGDQGIPYPCRGGIDFLFIDSRGGDTYPCGYRGEENLGKYWDLDKAMLKNKVPCHQCDWECFRDPSELFGPLLQAFSSPLDLLKKMTHEGLCFRLWVDDMKYYQVCRLFDGRRPPAVSQMRGF